MCDAVVTKSGHQSQTECQGEGALPFALYNGDSLHVVVFWVMTPCSDMVGQQCFRGPCFLHLQGEDTQSESKSLTGFHHMNCVKS